MDAGGNEDAVLVREFVWPLLGGLGEQVRDAFFSLRKSPLLRRYGQQLHSPLLDGVEEQFPLEIYRGMVGELLFIGVDEIFAVGVGEGVGQREENGLVPRELVLKPQVKRLLRVALSPLF